MEQNRLSPEERNVYEKFPLPFCVLSVYGDNYVLQAVSDGFRRAFRISRGMLPALTSDFLKKCIHPDDLSHLRPDLESACFTPDGQFRTVCRIRTGESSPYRPLSVRGSIERQTDGSYFLYACFFDVDDETEMYREETGSRLRQDVLLSDILSTTKTAIFWKDADRRFLGANRAFLDYYGFTDEKEILGKNDEDMGWHSEPDPYKNDELCVLRDGISTYRVHGKCMAKGKNRDIVASKSPLVVDGQIVGLVGSFEDVTKEKEQQAEIRRLNAKLEEQLIDRDLLMSISEVCIVKISLADFKFLEYNDAMCRMIGCTSEEYERQYHHSMETFFTGEYKNELDSLKKAVTAALNEGKNRFTLSLRIPSVHGPVWVGGSASFTDFDPDTNMPRSMYAVYRDITDIIEAQKKLELAEIEIQKAAILETQLSKMRNMLDGVSAGIGALRIRDGVRDTKIQLNRYFTEHIDIAAGKDSIVDLKEFLNSIHPDDRVQMNLDYQEFLRVKTSMTRQYRFRTVGGDYIWISVQGTVERLSEHTEIAYFTYTDINAMKIVEEELQESRHFYQEVVQAAKLSTWEYSIKDHTIMMSGDDRTKKMSSILALPKIIENVPDALLPLISEEDQSVFLDMYRKVEQGQDAFCEVWYKPVNGREPRCERVTYIAVPSSSGMPARAIGFSQNITAERKVEERYQRELGYLRQTDENNLGAKGHYDLTKNTVLEYTTKNDSFFRIQPGISYDEALHEFVRISREGKERQEISDKLDRARLIDRYQHGQMQTNLVYRRTRKGDLPLWISLNVHIDMSPETGNLEAFTYAYDVTDKMETDEIIGLISEVQFDFIGLIYAETDEFEYIRKSAKIDCGKEGIRFCYSKASDHICNAFIEDEDRKQYFSAVSLDSILAGLHAGGGRYTTTYRRTENGRVLCKQLDYVWLNEQEKIVLAVRSDVTASFEHDQEQMARIEAAKLEADRANEAKSAFLSSMSHDLRTPLNGVLGFTSFALKEPDPKKKQEYLEKIDASGRLLLDLVNDTLELSRIESGKAALNEEAVMSDDLVPAVVTALRPSAELKGIRLISDLGADASVPVWCDKLKCQKIALNLISNAIKYTPEGGTVSVSLKPLQTDVPNCKMSFIVEDSGIGMSEEFMKRMYEPFSQEKRSETQKVAGTGLGLSIVRHYVDLMGGKIEVTSRLHQGTRWVVSLPVRKVQDGLIQKKILMNSSDAMAGKHALLCEDNFMNTEIAVMLLKERGILVETAENGEIGLEKFSASGIGFFDFIMMDIRMPVMDGYTATGKIRELNRPDAMDIPIIAMTADAFEESIREAKKAGMDGYVTKPIDPRKLFETLEMCSRHGQQHFSETE